MGEITLSELAAASGISYGYAWACLTRIRKGLPLPKSKKIKGLLDFMETEQLGWGDVVSQRDAPHDEDEEAAQRILEVACGAADENCPAEKVDTEPVMISEVPPPAPRQDKEESYMEPADPLPDPALEIWIEGRRVVIQTGLLEELEFSIETPEGFSLWGNLKSKASGQ